MDVEDVDVEDFEQHDARDIFTSEWEVKLCFMSPVLVIFDSWE